MRNNKKINFASIIIIGLLLCYYGYREYMSDSFASPTLKVDEKSYNLNSIPEYNGNPYVIINNNEPDFSDLSHSTVSFEVYSELDSLGRCREAYANLGKDLMPNEERKSIGSVKPT